MIIWYILLAFGIFHDHLVYFLAIWYILWPFGIFYDHLVHTYILSPLGIFCSVWYIFPFLVWCTKKNLATLLLCTDVWPWFGSQEGSYQDKHKKESLKIKGRQVQRLDWDFCQSDRMIFW
jgi:hypothetical protein